MVATIGDQPDTQWLAGTGLDISDGVLCDESLRVVGADGIVAAGTVARWPNPRYGADAAPVRTVDRRAGAGPGRGADAACTATDGRRR